MCRPGARRGGAGGGAWRAVTGLGCGGCGAGRCSHWMPASVQSWWDRCHGERPASWEPAPWEPAPWEPAPWEPAPWEPAPWEPAPWEPVPWVRGWPERTGWKPGPPARPYRAWVGPRARGAGFGVTGEDQDPSGSRMGEGTGLAFGHAPPVGQGLAVGRGLADAAGARSGWAAGGGSGARSGWAAGGGSGACRNHPAGGATPGQESPSAAGAATAGSGPGTDGGPP